MWFLPVSIGFAAGNKFDSMNWEGIRIGKVSKMIEDGVKSSNLASVIEASLDRFRSIAIDCHKTPHKTMVLTWLCRVQNSKLC